MILNIILFILIILVLALIMAFLFLIFNPSISIKNKKFDDFIVNIRDKKIFAPEQKKVFTITDKKAYIMCNCNKQFSTTPVAFDEKYSCSMIKNLYGSKFDCKFACIGQGDCAKICTQSAISVNDGKVVISELCCGCGKCQSVCPQNIIQLFPRDVKKAVICSNHEEKSYTTCDKKDKEENLTWPHQKHFKVWSYCYRIIFG